MRGLRPLRSKHKLTGNTDRRLVNRSVERIDSEGMKMYEGYLLEALRDATSSYRSCTPRNVKPSGSIGTSAALGLIRLERLKHKAKRVTLVIESHMLGRSLSVTTEVTTVTRSSTRNKRLKGSKREYRSRLCKPQEGTLFGLSAVST